MTAGVGKARPPRSFPTGLAKCLRPGAQTQTVAKPRTWEKAAFLASRLLNHSRFPDGRAHGFAAPLRVALPPPVASAHRAHASLRAFGRSQRSGKRCGIRLWGTGGKRQPCGLPGAAQSAPQVRRREVSALWAVAAKGGKATRRREQIQGLRAASAQNADICERQGSANDGATDDPPAPRALSASCARPALPGGAFLCPFHSPRNVIHYTQPFFPAA